MNEDPSDWLDSQQVALVLTLHRRNDIRVQVHGIGVPIADVAYDPYADMVMIRLAETSADYRIATADCPPNEVTL